MRGLIGVTNCKICGSEFANAGLMPRKFDKDGRCLSCYFANRKMIDCDHDKFVNIGKWKIKCLKCKRKFKAKLLDIPYTKEELLKQKKMKEWYTRVSYGAKLK